MEIQENSCCLCLNELKDSWNLFSEEHINSISYYTKLSTSLPQLELSETCKDFKLCQKCCKNIDFVYEFSNECIKNYKIFIERKTKQDANKDNTDSNILTNFVKCELADENITTNPIPPNIKNEIEDINVSEDIDIKNDDSYDDSNDVFDSETEGSNLKTSVKLECSTYYSEQSVTTNDETFEISKPYTLVGLTSDRDKELDHYDKCTNNSDEDTDYIPSTSSDESDAEDIFLKKQHSPELLKENLLLEKEEEGFNEETSVINENILINKEKKSRANDFCFYCEDHVLNFSRHIIRKHSSEYEVKKILSKPVKSKERKELITILRKKGNFITNSNKCTRPMKKTKTISETKFLPCTFCLGFYSAKFLWRHRKSCVKNTNLIKSNRCQSDAQNFLIKNVNVDTKLMEKVFPRMRPDIISLVAKKDILICEFGAHYMKNHKEKHALYVTSRKMRELAKLLIELRKLETSIKTLLDSLQLKYFYLIVQAVKIIAKYDEKKDSYMTPTYAMNINTTLRQCCEIILFCDKKKQIYLTSNQTDAELKTMISLFESHWKFDISVNTKTSNTFSESENVLKIKKTRILERWTESQKDLVKSYFKEHIIGKKAPKRKECEVLIKENSDVLHNKSWLKIKVFVQNLYTKKT